MKKLPLLLALLILFISCKKNEPGEEVTKDEFNDPDWIKLEVPSAGEINAIAGSIDDTLLVTTRTKAYFTVDKGASWQESKHFGGPVPGLLTIQDTIYAFQGYHIDADYKKSYALLPDYYTLDKGLTWKYSTRNYRNMVIQTGIAQTSTNYMFKLNYHKGADKNGNGSNLVLQTTISKIDSNGNEVQFNHPIDRQPLNLYIDPKDRLYVACSGGEITETGTIMGASMFAPAYIFITKAPVTK